MICSYVNHARLRSWNQTVSRNDGKVSCRSLMHYHTLTLYRLCTIKKPPFSTGSSTKYVIFSTTAGCV